MSMWLAGGGGKNVDEAAGMAVEVVPWDDGKFRYLHAGR